ncbi:PssE/Cps14G family polysaccharide biosynthesis glycosyltransferase [Robertmurraya massiliosenegalensis]|uniref:PssE/Cps14G family polysaccharide biosynthesis glycosyltransferase n=1 Tax=Robertmurraya massiliosenegalensis TaxID=1287657 RepID=UPI0002F6F292|nr:PssE/Cps14G family polysaccharide biosynthesis glycosyltransferase [Robertmurraya massiliosenegalensis]
MILVLLGTHELPFTRLLDEVERIKLERKVDDEIIVQSGHTKYSSEVLFIKPFVSYDEMDELFNKARLIITHAGTGSVITGLKKGKKVIAAPRLKAHGEHNDNHQLELVQVFESAGHILTWNEGEKLEEIIANLNNFEPKPFISQKVKMLTLLKDFIEKN